MEEDLLPMSYSYAMKMAREQLEPIIRDNYSQEELLEIAAAAIMLASDNAESPRRSIYDRDQAASVVVRSVGMRAVLIVIQWLNKR